MIDVHHHLIWGVDDGPNDLETSLAMAEEAMRDGITHVVCTPHHNDVYPYNKEIIDERFAELRHRLAGRLELSLACDFHLTAENIQEAEANYPRYSIDGNGYLMIEFPTMSIPPMLNQALPRIQVAGYRQIVTHPERYMGVLRKPELIAEWMQAGYLIQITASSFFGRFGRPAQTLANELLDRNWIHFLATDAHNMDGRAPHLKKTYDYVANRAGEETARRLCLLNPRAAIEGARWPVQPEPLGLWEGRPLRFHLQESATHAAPPRKKPAQGGKSFWSRLFSR